jgi:hypothetical protein
MATLVWSSKDYDRSNILSSTGSPATKLFNAILRDKYYQKSIRVNFRHNKYSYTPTDDYNNYVVRFRGITK